MDWPAVWVELRTNLESQPKCSIHPAYPHVKTLSQHVVNDIIQVEEEKILVRSHRTLREDSIEAQRFETWWNHLVTDGSASLVPGDPNNAHPWRSRVVGAILAVCLPNRILRDGQDLIRLIRR